MNQNISLFLLWKMYILVGIFFMSGAVALAQNENIVLQLIDEDTEMPVSFAHYTIGAEKGVSDAEGKISIAINPDDELQLSHVLYGNLYFKAEELSKLKSNGRLKLKQLEITLQPAVVMGVHTQKYPDEQLEINYQDLLSHDAGAFLEKSPAISSIKKSGSYGFDPVFRGFKYDQLNIVIDGGQSATAACPNRMDPPASQISLNMMDRVEVLKGPHSLRYGNAFGGTFNFVSPDPEFTETLTPFGRASVNYEGNGGIFRTEGALGIRNKWSNVKAFGAHSQGGNYKDGEGNDVPSTFKRSSFGTNLDFKLGKAQAMSISATNNIAKDVDFPSLPMDLRSDNTLLLNARHQVHFSSSTFSSLNTMVYGSFVDHEMDNLDKVLDPRESNAVTIAKTGTFGGRTEGKINFSKGWIYAGADLRITSQEGSRLREILVGPMMGNTFTDNVWQDGKMQQIGVFGEFHLNAMGNHIVSAIRFDNNQSEILDPDPKFIGETGDSAQQYLNTSFSFGFTRNISANTSVGLWIGRAQRSGSLTELYINYFPVGLDAYEMLGNPNLKPEINNQADANIKWQSDRSVIDLNAFVSYMTQFISSEIAEGVSPRMKKSPGVRRYINIDKAIMTGFEASWMQQLPFKLASRLSIAYTLGEDLTTQKPLPEIPPFEINLGIHGKFFKDKLKPELFIRQAFDQYRVSETFGETKTSAFTLVNVKASFALNKYLHLAAGVNNLFNISYYEHLSRAMRIDNGRPLHAPGTNVFGTVTVRF